MTEYKIGDSAQISKKITDLDVVQFSKITGDNNPLHLDEEYAKKSIFGERIVHGVLTLGLISSVIANRLPGSGSILISQEIIELSMNK